MIVAISLIATLLVAVCVVVVVACAFVAAASRHKKSAREPVALVGRTGTVEKELKPSGAVLVCGELLPARSLTGERISRASRVRVVGARGVCLEVERDT